MLVRLYAQTKYQRRDEQMLDVNEHYFYFVTLVMLVQSNGCDTEAKFL